MKKTTSVMLLAFALAIGSGCAKSPNKPIEKWWAQEWRVGDEMYRLKTLSTYGVKLCKGMIVLGKKIGENEKSWVPVEYVSEETLTKKTGRGSIRLKTAGEPVVRYSWKRDGDWTYYTIAEVRM